MTSKGEAKRDPRVDPKAGDVLRTNRQVRMCSVRSSNRYKGYEVVQFAAIPGHQKQGIA